MKYNAFHRCIFKSLVFAILIVAALQAQAVATDPQFGVFPAGSFGDILRGIAQWVANIGIPVVAFFIILTGFKFVAAQGNEEKLKEAKQMLVWTLVGAAVVMGSVAIANMIIKFAESLGAAA